MQQYFSRAMMVLSLAALLSLSACGGDDTSSDNSGSAGNGSATDTGSASVDAGGTADTGSAADTAVDPCSACSDNQDCVEDKCVDKKPPCGGKCPEGEICNPATDKCFKPTCEFPKAETFTSNKNLNKVIKLQLMKETEGCDLNDDAAPDNVAGKIIGIYAAANDALAESVKDGTIVILMAPSDWKNDKTEFTTDLLLGGIDPSTADCDGTQAGACKYTVDKASYDSFFDGKGTCPALVTFDPTTVDGDKMKAGGNKQTFQLNLPLVGINLSLKISKAQISGTVTDADSWKTTKDAKLCGVIGKDDLNKAIDAVPEELLKEIGFDKATIKSLVGGILKPDIDSDGDGEEDSISIALAIETVAAEVTGYAAE